MEDFSKAPQSVTEIRGKRDHDARKWTPRDVLMDLLRDIDAGTLKLDCLVVAFSGPAADGGREHGSSGSYQQLDHAIAAITRAQSFYVT